MSNSFDKAHICPASVRGRWKTGINGVLAGVFSPAFFIACGQAGSGVLECCSSFLKVKIS